MSLDLDFSKMTSAMTSAILKVLKDKGPEIGEYAKSESAKLAQTLGSIAFLATSKKITEEEARLQLDIQKQAAKAMLLTMEGLGILAVEAAINAALSVVKDTVNAAVRFPLIG